MKACVCRQGLLLDMDGALIDIHMKVFSLFERKKLGLSKDVRGFESSLFGHVQF